MDPAYRTGAQKMAATTTELTLPRPTPICTVIPSLFFLSSASYFQIDHLVFRINTQAEIDTDNILEVHPLQNSHTITIIFLSQPVERQSGGDHAKKHRPQNRAPVGRIWRSWLCTCLCCCQTPGRKDAHDLDHVVVIFIRLLGRRRHGDSSEVIEKKT